MKTNLNLKFNFLNPDFTVFEDEISFVKIEPVDLFYFKHKLICWFNFINCSINNDFNFDNIIINRYMISKRTTFSKSFRVSTTFSINNLAGTLYLVFENNKFKNFKISNCKLFNNKLYFPKTYSSFELDVEFDNLDEVKKYHLTNMITPPICSHIDDIVINYEFNKEHIKVMETIIVYDKRYDEELVFKQICNSNEINFFDDFFNNNISLILNTFNVFKELYPYFDFNNIDSNYSLASFYLKLKDIYINDAFEKNFEENINVLKMSIF